MFLAQLRLTNNQCAALLTMSQFIVLLFLNRKCHVESKQSLGNANSETVSKHSHKQRLSLLSCIKFNFWGHAAVSHYSNVVSQLGGGGCGGKSLWPARTGKNVCSRVN